MHLQINKSFNYSVLLLSRFRLFKNGQNNFPCKRFSAKVQNESEQCSNDFNISKKIIENFLVPPISPSRLKEIHEVTGVTLKMGLISWIKISTQTLKITDWNLKKYADFKGMDELSILQLARDLKQVLPKSDLYLMEKTRSREATKVLNDIRLSSMLMVFLNDLDGVPEFDKVVFQKENVLNILHNLSIGNERVSTRKVFETILLGINERENGYGNFHSLKNINLEMLEFYDMSSLAAQECLSFVLLLTLSFIDVFICENVESLKKIQMQYKFRKIKR